MELKGNYCKSSLYFLTIDELKNMKMVKKHYLQVQNSRFLGLCSNCLGKTTSEDNLILCGTKVVHTSYIQEKNVNMLLITFITAQIVWKQVYLLMNLWCQNQINWNVYLTGNIVKIVYLFFEKCRWWRWSVSY